MNTSPSKPSHQTGMLWFAKDLPNICSLAGLLCALLGIYFAILKNFPAAIIGMIWAVLFDWGDGIIARTIAGRTDDQKNFGAQLDSLIDMVSFGICPAVFLLSYGEFSLWFLPGAFVIVATAAIRLSYFNIFGLVDSTTYKGLALDNNIIAFAFVFLFEPLFSTTTFSILLYMMFMIMAGFNLSPLRTPKFAGKWFYGLIVYTISLTIIYCWILSVWA
ncbi:MAG: CDP-alcohol phosphatidyltransferase family protein [Desulfobacula sp.]|jgi:phosphatidylserine synthase|nr:CDP-alcohol phosphatidyltransferase family protein [Desulfobacula sp.]